MKIKEIFEGFSLKKMLLTILCTVIVSVFVGFTIFFLSKLESFLMLDITFSTPLESEVVKTMSEAYEKGVLEPLDKAIEEYKNDFGEDYPARAVHLMGLHYNVMGEYMQIYLTSTLSGTVLGIIVYIVIIQKAKGKQAIAELLLVFVVLVVIITILNWGYNVLFDIWTSSLPENEYIKSQIFIYDLGDNTLIIVYIVAAVVLYVGNLIKQKMLTNKLNKELNNK